MTFAFYWLKSMEDRACLYYKLTHELKGSDELKRLEVGGVGPVMRKAKVINIHSDLEALQSVFLAVLGNTIRIFNGVRCRLKIQSQCNCSASRGLLIDTEQLS